jgi:uncharacterized protein
MDATSALIGYTPARLVRDYTHRIDLSEGHCLVFNMLTGLGWRGASADAVTAEAAVESHRGDEIAASVLAWMESEFSRTSQPVAFQLIPTYGCNFSCAYCYEGSLTSEQRQWNDADIANVVAACQRLVEASGTAFSEAKFTVLGGEVIRASTFAGVDALVRRLREVGGQRFEAVTNGYELADHAERMRDLGITHVQVTMDGPKEMHDKRRPIRLLKGSSFEQILEGVDRCLGLGMRVSLRINIDQRNIPALGKLVATFDARGWLDHPRFWGYLAPLERDFSGKMRFVSEDEMARMLFDEVGREPRLLRLHWALHGLEFIYALRSGEQPQIAMRYCGATRGDYTLDARNGVYACWFGAGQDEFRVGEISDVAAGKPLDGEGQRRLERWRKRGIMSVEPCGTCKWALVCGGGCAFKAKAKTGSMMSPNCAPFASIYAAIGRLIFETPPELRHDGPHRNADEVVAPAVLR